MKQHDTAAVRKRGRPPGGVRRGERLRDYPALTVRIPPDTRAILKALSARRGIPTWLMLRHLVVCFVRRLPPGERQRILRRSKVAA
jgi:hypothetical protein